MTKRELTELLDGSGYKPYIQQASAELFLAQRTLDESDVKSLSAFDPDQVLFFGHLWAPGGQDFSGWVWTEKEWEIVDLLAGEARRLELI